MYGLRSKGQVLDSNSDKGIFVPAEENKKKLQFITETIYTGSRTNQNSLTLE